MTFNDEVNSHDQRPIVKGQQSKVNGQKSTVKGHRSKVKGQRSKVNSQRSTVKGQKSKVSSQQSAVNFCRFVAWAFSFTAKTRLFLCWQII